MWTWWNLFAGTLIGCTGAVGWDVTFPLRHCWQSLILAATSEFMQCQTTQAARRRRVACTRVSQTVEDVENGPPVLYLYHRARYTC
jgi:hypothetical protein